MPEFVGEESLARPLHRFWVTLARGTHPFPSGTRKLSLSAPMVLHARVCGSVGSCPVYHMARPKGRAFVFLKAIPLGVNYSTETRGNSSPLCFRFPIR